MKHETFKVWESAGLHLMRILKLTVWIVVEIVVVVIGCIIVCVVETSNEFRLNSDAHEDIYFIFFRERQDKKQGWAIFLNYITEAQSQVDVLVLFPKIQQRRQGDIRYTIYCLSRFFEISSKVLKNIRCVRLNVRTGWQKQLSKRLFSR